MIRYFTAHPTAANLLMLVFIILGLLGLPKLQRDTFPVIPATMVEVRVVYPGATPVDVENGVCRLLEEALEALTDLIEMRCDARENIAIVTAEMREDANLSEFYNDVKSAVEAISSFPSELETPSIVILERTAVVARIAITGNMSAADLKIYADGVKERIKRDPRIAQVNLKGFSAQEIAVQVSKEKLHRYGLSLADISNAIRAQSLNLPSGTLETKGANLIVRYTDERRAAQEFADLIILADKTGGEVRLGDIAQIKQQFERAEEKIIFNQQRAAVLEIIKTESQDALRIMDAVQQNLQRERSRAPHGVRLDISQDVTSNIRERLRLIVSNGGMGLVLVMLTMWAFFSLRYAFWVAMGLPIAFLGAVYVMSFLGYSINMITMIALLVAIGILMDDAIVIAENIAAQIRKGKAALEATIDGVKQVLPGVFSSFLTTIMILTPLAFMTGKMGAVLKYMPIILVITLAVSLIEAFLILPAHLYHSLSHMENNRRSGFHCWFDKQFDSVRDSLFMPLVKLATHHAPITLGVLLFILIASLAALPGGMLKFNAFPDLESDVIEARILLPQSAPLQHTEQAVAQVLSGLKQLDEEFSPRQQQQRSLVRNVTVHYNKNIDAYESGTHIATVSADLLRAEQRVGSVVEMLKRWRTLTGDIPDALSLKFTDKERGIAGKAIDLQLQGKNLQRVKQASLELQAWFSSFQGVLEVSDDLRPGKPEIRVKLKEGASTLGISANTIAAELRAALNGSTGLEIQIGQESIKVAVRLAAADRDEFNDIQFLYVRSKHGDLIPLSSVAELEQTRDYSRIHRVNGQRTITMRGTIDPHVANARELMSKTKKQFLPDLKARYPDVKIFFRGQGSETQKTGGSLIINLLVGLFGVFVILSLQFRSYIQPIAVMLAIPMGFVGVIWGHLVLGINLSMPSLVGFATLAGIVVNDNILLVAFIKERLAAGMSILQAAQLAAQDRFRAIILTSLTTIAGLLPMLLETSTQAMLLIPIVTSLAFGLFAVTLFSILLIPAFFVMLYPKPENTSH
ncbi:efflux RND transporter permease subunit [Candidatus Venteria ishoeyi]|uniref:Antibiotic efflux pump membrane transporter ArpB n=1 Tax=Candidatus Venteria ishoeyi TaxID=1899563 RepID=A0A1H6FF62_9GAMM|nr:efflux RND transporter permease subunit [Candidatus Venteria ishoeyi]SEH08710.1 Antibiotic efflux pump membrane transporter ArpB [Candidatus Venteria ishoeyi]